MPPKKVKAKGVAVDLGEQRLRCEWGDCVQAFASMQTFIKHMTNHISEYYKTWDGHSTGIFECKWRECGSKVTGHTTDFNRHVYFHAFHVKIKNVGAAVVEKLQITPCQQDTQSRNLIPELPERLHCGWSMCEVVYDNPEYFYIHMDMHAANFPDGNNVAGGCKCQWEGCDTTVKSKYKLREHLRSHTQEKMIACPICGALFASRTKFLDHLKRQGNVDVQCYECSHCNKRFTSERLLRDHMRHHVNHYKCPYCDMTCPTPSGLRNHLRYRHTDDRPYKCDQCDYSCKSPYDLRRHMDTHTIVKTFQCHIADCEFQTRSYQTLSHHFTKEHQGLEAARYACHVCNCVFTRGHHLTLHLKRQHKFKWPSGHSRFRYKPHEDGFLRLQTVRYESVELMDQMVNDPSSSVSTNQTEQNQENVAPTCSSVQRSPSSCNSNKQQIITEQFTPNVSSGSESIGPTAGDSQGTENMAYNLEMLGDVALHLPCKAVYDNFRPILPRPAGATLVQQQQQQAQCEQMLQGTNHVVLQGTSQHVLQGMNQQLLKQGTSQVILQDTCQSAVQGTSQTMTNSASAKQPDNTRTLNVGEPQMLTLQNVAQSTLEGQVYTFGVQETGQAVCFQLPTQYVQNTADNQGYVLCSPMEVGSDDISEDDSMDGAEADIFRLQAKARSRSAVVNN